MQAIATVDPLVIFLYLLVRDFSPGKVDDLLASTKSYLYDADRAGVQCDLKNGYLAQYAIEIASYLRKE